MRMHADVSQPQRLRVLDQHAQNTVPPREVADPRTGGAVDPECKEPLEAVAAVVQDAERGIAGAGEIACGLEDGLEHRLQVEVRHERATHLKQTTQLDVAEPLAGLRSGNVAHGLSMVQVGPPANHERVRPV